MSSPVKSPCVKVCVVDGQTGFCLGCGRTLNEIARWMKLTDAERTTVWQGLPPRLDQLKSAGKLT
jgi:predicted Fe-S protein YdhL (DUF1289 family)